MINTILSVITPIACGIALIATHYQINKEKSVATYLPIILEDQINFEKILRSFGSAYHDF